MREEVRNAHAATIARYEQMKAYVKDHEDEYTEMDRRLLDATSDYLSFAEAGGLTTQEAVADLLRHIFLSYIK